MRILPDDIQSKLKEVGIDTRHTDKSIILLLLEILKELKKPSFG